MIVLFCLGVASQVGGLEAVRREERRLVGQDHIGGQWLSRDWAVKGASHTLRHGWQAMWPEVTQQEERQREEARASQLGQVHLWRTQQLCSKISWKLHIEACNHTLPQTSLISLTGCQHLKKQEMSFKKPTILLTFFQKRGGPGNLGPMPSAAQSGSLSAMQVLTGSGTPPLPPSS
jgi:hypothetical protein